MIITAVERTAKRRGRVDVYVDGIVACELARASAAAHGLRPGLPVEPADIERVVAADRRRLALETAVAMLARRPRSEREVRRRLAQRKLEPAIIDETIAKLTAARLLDDAEFARAWTESRDAMSPRGRRLIVQELRSFGVEATLATVAAEEVSEPEAAYRFAAKRARSMTALDYAAFRNKLGSALQRRGFAWDVARTTVERCWRESGNGESIEDQDFAE